MKTLAGAAVLLFASCAGNAGGLVSAVVASGVSRATGGCYASCATGTACDGKTGLCEELPCRGRCEPGQVCDTKRGVPACISAGERELTPGPSATEAERVTPR